MSTFKESILRPKGFNNWFGGLFHSSLNVGFGVFLGLFWFIKTFFQYMLGSCVSLYPSLICAETKITALGWVYLTSHVLSLFISDHASLLLFLFPLPSSILPFLHFSMFFLFFHPCAAVSFTSSCSIYSYSQISA